MLLFKMKDTEQMDDKINQLKKPYDLYELFIKYDNFKIARQYIDELLRMLDVKKL